MASSIQRYFAVCLASCLVLTACSPSRIDSAAVVDDAIGLPAPTPFDASLAFPNVLNLEGAPAMSEDWSVFSFSDLGSWQSFGLPEASDAALRGGFTGPFQMRDGRWISRSFMRLGLFDVGKQAALDLATASEVTMTSYPGRLQQQFVVDGVKVRLDLRFVSSRSALVYATLVNQRQASVTLQLSWQGALFPGVGSIQTAPRGVQATLASGGMIAAVSVPEAHAVSLGQDGLSYVVTASQAIEIAPGERAHGHAVQSLTFGRDELLAEHSLIDQVLADPVANIVSHMRRWNDYLAKTNGGPAYRDVAVKSLQTLVTNWRAPAGAMLHDGLFPSYAIWYFNGFWAWDSWKHAAAIARFDPQLAKQQIRTMYAYQDAAGMIPDVIYFDPSENNFRNTKPPLSSWAIWQVYERSGDAAFVAEMYDAVVRYHQWWYVARDNDQNGLCEYGSTDGSAIAAKWESGMDNAVRFDNLAMLNNGAGSWSMDRESVDLNAYLYAEKRTLGEMASLLGKSAEAQSWQAEADALKALINAMMFDPESGYYYDISIASKSFISIQGPEGWIPLWAGVAEETQAAGVRNVIVDPNKFASHVPFPTVGQDQPGFSDGYWRGLVWLDQAYFGVVGLKRYGYDSDALALTTALLNNLEGVTGSQAPIRENYHPLTGEGRNANHFSWSAAHLLMLQMDVAGAAN
jgi:putative isomerase